MSTLFHLSIAYTAETRRRHVTLIGETDRHVYGIRYDQGEKRTFRKDWAPVDMMELYGPIREALGVIAGNCIADIRILLEVEEGSNAYKAAFWRVKNQLEVGYSAS